MFDCIIRGDIRLCISTEILLEYHKILNAKNGPEVAENVMNLVITSPFTVRTEVYYDFRLILEDDDDNKFVNCAIASNAIVLVSNDRHFQVLKTVDFSKVDVLTVGEFEQSYKDALAGK
ncbi:MAG: PIN domain-containing protein [Tunicatimonas sp.]